MHETSASGHSAPLMHPPSPFALARSRPVHHPQRAQGGRLSSLYTVRDPRVLCHLAGNFASYLLESLLSSLTATPSGKMERVPEVPSPWRAITATGTLYPNAGTELEFRLKRKGACLGRWKQLPRR